MSKQIYSKRPKGRSPFLYAILIIIVAIAAGTLLFYGYEWIKSTMKRESDYKQPVVTETIIPTLEATSEPSVTPLPTVQPTVEPTPTPVKTEEPVVKKPTKVKGIYVTGPMAGSKKYMDDLINLVDTTELNAMVIDIKNDHGEITYKMDQKLVNEIGAGTAYIRDIEDLIKQLKEKDIYLIARIVAFKDPLLAQKKPELSLKTMDGTIFRDAAGLSWVNPYKKEVWKYLVAVASEAAELGFDEIQFDYIRFSTDSGMKHVNFGKAGQQKTKMQVITEFTKYAYQKLSEKGVYVSADVYGTIINSQVDANIVGQNYADMASYLDYICPMIYPSHYASGVYNIQYPDTQPYDIIYSALVDSKKVLEQNNNSDNKQVAIVRPWLQDFTATWVKPHIKYGKNEIRAQIKAVEDAGYEEWILWNGKNSYTKEGLQKE